MGDIGEPQKHIEFEPLTAPAEPVVAPKTPEEVPA